MQTAGTQDYPASLKSWKLKRVNTVSQFPEEMIYKMSYQTTERPSEGDFFSRFNGHFGVVDVVGFHVCSPDDYFGSTSYHFSNASFLPFDKKSRVQVGIPEPRVLHCTAVALEGLPLLGFPDALPKPPELLESILHSMIGKTPLLHFYSISRHSHLGHYNLFLGGVLHRGISEGNIVCL